MRFSEDAQLSPEAKDLICRLMCDVDHRLGTRGAHEIKVRCSFYLYIAASTFSSASTYIHSISTRLIVGSRVWSGINCMKWRQHLNHKSTESWIPKTS